MILSGKIRALIEEFINSETMQAVEHFASEAELKNENVNLIAKMFGFNGDFSDLMDNSEKKIIISFKNNLKLLIQKTWVEKSDIELKEQILFQLNNLCKENDSWSYIYPIFLEIISNAVYLMFGRQTKSDDFCEYSLRIDPEFGIFWWYIQGLPRNIDWIEEKYRIAILLGMYFLANY